jgi:hypothetical protein
MRGKILFATGLAVGYVLGTRAGREKYDQLMRAARGFWNDPRVQRRVDQVEEFVREKAPEVAEFVTDNAKKVVGRAPAATSTRGGGASSSARTSAAKRPSGSGSSS